MERPSELLKSFCNRLARTAITNDGREVVKLLRDAGFLGVPVKDSGQLSSQAGALPAKAANPDRVGIWDRKKDGDRSHFVRSLDTSAEWQYWARVGRIGARMPGKCRVVLIGESVARGYLYDPQFTPAMALETILQAQTGKNEFEVIDLARTSLQLDNLKALAISALMLEPDAIVIFAGNNWGGLGESSSVHITDLMHEQGIKGLQQCLERQLAEKIRGLVKEVGSSYQAKNVPVVWVVPEFNLHDWRDPFRNAPHLVNGANNEWIIAYEAAQRALQEEDFATASQLARQMLELDGGIAGATFYILAECSERSGDLEATRAFLESARDCAIWDRSMEFSPRSFSVTQATLQAEAATQQHQVVDLPGIFKEYLKQAIPDRRMFLDYCHMSVEAIKVSMAAVASAILRLLKQQDIPWPVLAAQCVTPNAKTQSEAEFLAAIHNAHYHQPYPVVYYHCVQALRLCPENAQLIMQYLELQTRRTPMMMSTSAEQIGKFGSAAIQHYLFANSLQQLDPVLLNAMAAALAIMGINARKKLNEIWRDEYGSSHGKQDLLHYYFCFGTHQTQETKFTLPEQFRIDKWPLSHYYKAYWLESRFIFIAEEDRPVQLCFTGRLPGSSLLEGAISLSVNQQLLGLMAISQEWSTWDILIAGDFLKNGVNEIIIRWPAPPPQDAHVFQELQTPLDVFSVFGEIHSITVSVAQKIAPGVPDAAGHHEKAIPV